MNINCYYLGFNLTPGIGSARLRRLIDVFGTVQHAWEAPLGDLVASGLDAKSCQSIATHRRQIDIEHELERLERAHTKILCWDDDEYPALLRHIPLPPPLIYVRGTLSAVDAWALGVVGTRNPTSYGKEATRRLVNGIAEAGVTVVSGLALGIDTHAHAGALEVGGRTIAVLGSGVDVPYPERNRNLAEQIVEQGALVSEFPLGTMPVAANFPVRNRLISGLSLGTLVVEAGTRSGALITVGFALEQGRDVLAVPGQIYSHASDGTHQLIRSGATLVTSAQDILEALNLTATTTQQEMKQVLPDDPIEANLMQLLGYHPLHIDELVRASGMAAPMVSSVLAMMELKGMVRQSGAMQYVLVRERRVSYQLSP